jgi:hypothetical protein
VRLTPLLTVLPLRHSLSHSLSLSLSLRFGSTIAPLVEEKHHDDKSRDEKRYDDKSRDEKQYDDKSHDEKYYASAADASTADASAAGYRQREPQTPFFSSIIFGVQSALCNADGQGAGANYGQTKARNEARML